MSQNLSLIIFSNTVPLMTNCSLLSDVLRLAENVAMLEDTILGLISFRKCMQRSLFCSIYLKTKL